VKTDKQLKADVEAELEWEPSIDAANVGVAVHDGVVTLTGHLNTFAEKTAIERVVWRVAGVAAVAVELDVKLSPGHVRNDTEIAQAAEQSLKWNAFVPDGKVRVKVEKGWVTLSGELEWEHQRQAADKAVRFLTGVRGMVNLVMLKPRATPQDVAARIGEALARRARRESEAIKTTVSDSTVFLRGEVDTPADRDAAVVAAWSAPGVNEVINELTLKA
jgi:osmotically-inducible protein OsmY